MNTPVPELFPHFPSQISPHVQQAREHLADWAQGIGLVHRETARRRFAKADFGWFAAAVYPTASGTHLNLMANWFAWLFLVDDQLDDGQVGRSRERVGAIVREMCAVLQSPDFGAAIAKDSRVPVAVSSLGDLWSRTAPDAPDHWRRRFVQHLDDCLTTAATWEAGNRISGTVPDEQTYITNRRHTGAIYVCMDLIEIVEGVYIPEPVYDSEIFTAALNAACDVVCWTNDVYSLKKERFLGEVHNLVYIVQHHRQLTPEKALSHVCSAVSGETERFLQLEAELLRAHPEHTALLMPCLAGMRSWMRGNLDWSSRTKRYDSSDHPGEVTPEEYLESAVVRGDR